MNTDELIAATRAPIYSMGSAFYFVPETTEVGKAAHGLDGFRFYFLGRGGVLGDTNAATVHSAFGYFNPAIIESMWTSGSAKAKPSDVAATYWECCAAFGRAHFGAVAGLPEFNEAADAVIAAADPTGLTLFAGMAAMPLAADDPGRAMQQVAVLRELRGSAHIAAIRAVGLSPLAAHAIRRPDAVTMFGWEADSIAVGDGDEALLDRAEALTDVVVRPAFAALDQNGRQAFIAGITALQAALTESA